MTQLDRIEAKLTRLLEIAEELLSMSGGDLQGSLVAAETAETLQDLKEEFSAAVKVESSLVDAEQNIKDLFIKYPQFKEDFFKLDEELAGLKGPVGASILKESTIGMIAKSLRIDVDGFVNQVNKIIPGYK